MVRVTKDPQERRTEFIEKATELFFEKGFENVSVNEIVKKVNVAKGTFYHYFESKDEIVRCVVLFLADFYVNSISMVINEEMENPVKKLDKIFNKMFFYEGNRGGELFHEYIHKPENIDLHNKIAREIMKKLYEIIYPVIKEGVENKLFNVEHPDRATEILMVVLFVSAHEGGPVEFNVEEKWKMFEIDYFINKILGTKKGYEINIDLKKYDFEKEHEECLMKK